MKIIIMPFGEFYKLQKKDSVEGGLFNSGSAKKDFGGGALFIFLLKKIDYSFVVSCFSNNENADIKLHYQGFRLQVQLSPLFPSNQRGGV